MDLCAVKQRITKLRGNMTKKEFAGLLGFSASYLSQIENLEDTQKPSIEALFSISEVCGVSIDYILTGRDYTSSGLATNQSFVGMGDIGDTPLGRNMIKNLSRFNRELIPDIMEADRIGSELSNLKALEGSAAAVSLSPEVSKKVNEVKDDSLAQAL